MRILTLGVFFAVLVSGSALAQSGQDCLAALRNDFSLSVISDKVALAGGKDREFSLMAVPGYPSEVEKQAIQAWLRKREDCWRTYPPPENHPAAALYAKSFRASQMLILRLLRGELNYGKFNEIRSEMGSDHDKELQQLRAQYDQQQYQQQQQQKDRQQQTLQLLLQQQQQQQQQYQQQQYQQQQELQQRNFYADQACLDRARNQSERQRCKSEAGIRDGVQGLIRGIGGQ